MRADWTLAGSTFSLELRLDPEDEPIGPGQGDATVRMVTNRCSIELPSGAAEPHPDLLAVAALSVARPWVSARLTLDRPVSADLATVLAAHFSIDVSPVEADIGPRAPGPEPVLCYSGGADSIAVSELVPGAAHVHFRRQKHPRLADRATHHRADVLEQLVLRARDRGRSVHITRSDLEFLCLPHPQFPAWVTLGVGAVLMADQLSAGALAFGTVLESRYLEGGRRWAGEDPDPWAHLFRAVGLPFLRPAAGMTEISTAALAMDSPLADLARSCLLGGPRAPCWNCEKCLRKELVAAALEERPLPSRLLENIGPDHDVALALTGPPPYHMQNVLEFALVRVPGLEGTWLERTAGRLRHADRAGTAWQRRYFGPALVDEVPDPFGQRIRGEIGRRMEMMSPEEERIVRTWNASARARPAARPPVSEVP